MDHSDQIKQNLEMLGLTCLDHLSLEQLSGAMSKNLPSGLSDNRILNIYTMWLHSRLMVIDGSVHGAVPNEIAAWHRYLGALGNEDWAIADAFDSWQRGEAIADPTSSRRLTIAREELLRLMPPSPASSDSIPTSREPEGPFGHMHPDRLRMSRASPEVIELDDDSEDDVVAKADNPHQYGGKGGQPNLSFLTGSNKLALKDLPRARASDEGSRISQQHGDLSLDGYVCNRCGLKGHDIRECPTNWDPTFDKAPPVNYKCDFCDAIGLHYGPLCPKHPDKNSIMHQRHRIAVELGWTDRYRPDRPEGNIGGSRSKRPKGDRWSPAHGVADRHVADRFRPADESTDRRTSRSRGHEGKRRVSRSPSPKEMSERQKKKQKTRLKMEARHFFTKTAGPRDDLLRREKNQADEGRLSYDDEVDDDPQSPLPESQVFGSPAEGKMDVDDLVRPRSENANGAAPATEDESLEFEVLEMIQTESKKTDLLFLVNGVEHMSACDPTVVKLFEGQENIFINGALGKARPRPTDFYELRDEGEREVGEMDCEGVHEKPADTKAEEARMAAMNGLTICPALVGGADSGMSSPEHASAAEVAAAAGLVILARACLPTESAPFNQMETESIEIRAAPDRLDDQIPIEGVTEPATAEEAVDKSPENKVVACEVAFLKASRQDATDFSGAQCQDDTAMEVEESAAPTSGPVDKATDGDMAGPESLPVATEMSSSDSTPRSISPMANVQTSPCPGLVEEAASSETTSFESSPAAGDPTTPCRVLGEALGSDTAACGTVAEAEKPTSPKRIADETPCSESVEPASTSAAEISVCQNICVETPASEKARLEITPQSQDPTVPCQPLVGEAPESDKSDIGISPVATPPTPSCRSGAKETSVVESDKVVDPLLAVLDAVLAEQTTPVPEPGHDSELPPAVQAVPAKEATGPQPGQDAETPKDVQAVLPEEGLASMPGQEAEFPKVLQAAHLNEPSQGDEAPSKPAPGSEVSQAMAG